MWPLCIFLQKAFKSAFCDKCMHLKTNFILVVTKAMMFCRNPKRGFDKLPSRRMLRLRRVQCPAHRTRRFGSPGQPQTAACGMHSAHPLDLGTSHCILHVCVCVRACLRSHRLTPECARVLFVLLSRLSSQKLHTFYVCASPEREKPVI